MSPSSDTPHSGVPKIAMKGFSLSAKPGSKPLSFSTKPTSKPSPSSTSTTLGKRPRAALHADSDSEDERPVKHEVVTGFDGGIAVTESSRRKEKELLVIPKIGNRDWKAEMRKPKGKNLLPPEVQARARGEHSNSGKAVTKDVINTEADMPQWGLTIKEKKTIIESNGQLAKTEEKPAVPDQSPVDRSKEKSQDQLAIEALMGIAPTKTGPDLVIPTTTANETLVRESEEDAYKRAIREAPDVSTLEDYEAVPVEDFGAALLRGMGWKEGDTKKGRIDRPKEVVRRPNRLGLGAKELKNPEELGAWIQTGNGRRGGGDRRPKANEYRERREKERDGRDEKYGSHRRDRDRDDGYRRRVGDRDRDRRH